VNHVGQSFKITDSLIDHQNDRYSSTYNCHFDDKSSAILLTFLSDTTILDIFGRFFATISTNKLILSENVPLIG